MNMDLHTQNTQILLNAFKVSMSPSCLPQSPLSLDNFKLRCGFQGGLEYFHYLEGL